MTAFGQKLWRKLEQSYSFSSRLALLSSLVSSLGSSLSLVWSSFLRVAYLSAGGLVISARAPSRHSARLPLVTRSSSLGSQLVSRLAIVSRQNRDYDEFRPTFMMNLGQKLQRISARNYDENCIVSRLAGEGWRRVNKWRVNYDEFRPRIMTNFVQEFWRVLINFHDGHFQTLS